MKKETQQLERKGLPGGPNEMFTYTTGIFSTEGFRMDSPDVNNYQNIIPSGSISMREKDGSPLRKGTLLGVDNLGNEQVMYPGFDYQFPGTEVTETLMAKMGGALLDKTIKCGNCGWQWKAADGGSDVMDCHKCGGKALIKAQQGGESMYTTSGNPIIIPSQGSYPLSYRDRGDRDTDGVLFTQAKKVSRVDENGKPLTRNQIAYNQDLWNDQKEAYGPAQQDFNIWKNNEQNTNQGYFVPSEYEKLMRKLNARPDIQLEGKCDPNFSSTECGISKEGAKKEKEQWNKRKYGGEGLIRAQDGTETKFKLKDERQDANTVQDNIQPLSLRQKKGNQLLMQETDNAKKDKQELQTTGQIKNPRSIHYKKLAPKQLDLKTQTKSNEELDGQLGLERPLIYLASPEKLLGDIGIPGMETSELDRQAVMANRFNPNQSRLDRFVNNAKIGLGYVPEATVNTAMAAAFMPEGSGALGLMNEAINPLVGLSTSIAPELRQGLRTAGPSFGSSVDNVTPTFKSEIDWSKWNKEIPENTQLMDEYSAIEQQAKADGTWMVQPRDYSIFSEVDEINLKGLKDKLAKGELSSSDMGVVERMIPRLENQKLQSTTFQGSPEQFVQQNSENFKKAYPNGFEKAYRGTYGEMNTENLAQSYPKGRGIFTGDLETGKHYAASPSGSLKELYHPSSSNSYDIDVKGRSWKEVPIESLPNMQSEKTLMGKPVASTDDIATWAENNNVDYVNMRNVFDGTDAKFSRIVNNKLGNYLKSAIGNNGMFDMTNPNIYKSILPFVGYTGAGALTYKALQGQQETPEYKQGGLIEYQTKGEVKIDLKHSQDIYDQIRPSEYTSLSNYGRYLFGMKRDKDEYDDDRSEEAFKQYLGLNSKPKYLSVSKYAPSIKGEGKKGDYYKVDPQLEQDIFNSYKDKLKLNQVLSTSENDVKSEFPIGTPMTSDGYVKLDPYDENLIVGRPMVSRARMLGNFNISKGQDKKGEYISYSDQYDFPDFIQSKMKGKPYKIYNRIYYNDMKEEGGETITEATTTTPSPLVEYVVKKGDTLSKIAAANNTSVRSIMKNNESIADPNVISINQKINLVTQTPNAPVEEVYKDWNTIRDKKDKINKLSDEQKIVSFHNNKPEESYLIVDKKNAVMKLYTGGNLTKSFEVGVGQNPGDAQTVTKVKNGKTDWSAGNKSTGAGIYTISNINPASEEYYNEPAFNLKNENGIEVSTTIHGTPKPRRIKFNNGTVVDNRMSNGCINGKCEDLKELYGQLDVNTKVYILPEDVGNNFQIVDGKPALRVSSKNRQRYNQYIDQTGAKQKGQGANQTTNTLVYKPIKATLDEERFKDNVFQWNDFNDEKEYASTTKPFIAALTTGKKDVMKAAKISSDVYNELAKMSFGIYGTESNYGDTHGAVGNLARATNKLLDSKSSSSPDYKSKASTYGADEDYRSVGLTQLRWNYLNKDEKAALKQVGITSNKDFLDPKKAAIGTVTVLGVRYNQQLNDKQKQDVWKYLPTKWNNRANYSDRVKSNSSYLSFKQLDKKQEGGEFDVDMYGNPIIAKRVNNPNLNRSYYDPRLNTMNIGNDYDIWGDEKTGGRTAVTGKDLERHRGELLAHENYHAKQHKEGKDNYDIAHHTDQEQWARMQKKPQMMTTDEVWNNYYNRSSKENDQDYINYINAVPEARILDPNLLFDKMLDRPRYANPFNIEGEAMYYNQTGKEFQKGGEPKPGSLMQAYNRLPKQKKMGGAIANKKQFGGQLNSGNINMYRDYIKGTIGNEVEAIKNYDKLNRIYYTKAKELEMTVSNYIMTYIANNS